MCYYSLVLFSIKINKNVKLDKNEQEQEEEQASILRIKDTLKK